MKKFLVILVSALLISINYISPAHGDTFNSSITVRPDETLEPRNEDEIATVDENGISKLIYDELDDCTTTVILTPYTSIDNAPTTKIKEDLIAAYNSIKSVTTYDQLTSEVIIEARKKGVTVNDLVIRDLFDISKTFTKEHHDDNLHDVDSIENIIIKTKTLKNFICLLHYKNGVWNVVPDVEILDDTTLRVSVASLSPFAIILANVDINPVLPKQDEQEVPVIEKPSDITPGQTEPIEPVTPIEPIEPVEPVIPVEPVEPHKGCCIYHWLIILTMIITILINSLLLKIKKANDDDLTDEEKEKLIKRNKKHTRIRYLVMLINLILCIIFYILGSCCLDIIALVLDIIVLVIYVISIRRKNKKNEEE